MSAKEGISIAGVFAFVSYLLSYGLHIPEDLGAFRVFAAAGAIAGLPIGRIAAERASNWRDRIVAVLVALAVCLSSFFYYMRFVESGALELTGIIGLAIALTVAFGSFTFLMTMAGITLVTK